MQIQREKFFALTAALAGFRPRCVTHLGDEAATESATTATSAETSATAATTASASDGATPGRRPVQSFGP